MRLSSANVLFAGIAGAVSLFLLGEVGASRTPGRGPAPPAEQPAKITVDYPLDGSVFPPEITPPTFVLRDASESAKRWVIEVSFSDHSPAIRVEAPGKHWRWARSIRKLAPAANSSR